MRSALHNNHRPLLCIWKKSRPPLRIERWGLLLQLYNYVMKCMPGSKNPTDYMSRNPINISGTHRHQKMAEQYVNFIAPSNTPRAMKIEDVKQFTENDDMMQRVIDLCRNGRWFQIQKTDVAMMREYYNVRGHYTSWKERCNPGITDKPSGGTCPRRASRHCQNKGTFEVKSLVPTDE